MSAPKPGDRVRVTAVHVGEVVEVREDGSLRLTSGKGTVVTGPMTSPNLTVEVLASPVYVNSDTTEYKPGDVARGVNDDPEVIHVRTFSGQWVGTDGAYYQDRHLASAKGLILLVRDGQVVQP